MKKLLVPVDGSECSWKAVKTARLFAEAVPAEITVVYVIPDLSMYHAYGRDHTYEKNLYDASRYRAQGILDEAQKLFSDYDAGNVHYITKSGEPAAAIVECAKDNEMDTIVIGSRGMGRMARLLIGSVSSKVVSHAPCSFMVVR